MNTKTQTEIGKPQLTKETRIVGILKIFNTKKIVNLEQIDGLVYQLDYRTTNSRLNMGYISHQLKSLGLKLESFTEIRKNVTRINITKEEN